MLRVDHSGEIAANTIYEAQADVFGFQGNREEKALIMEMWENERKHLLATSRMLDEFQARPSALVPVWGFAGRLLGGVTAVMGKKSAMACTEAVETKLRGKYKGEQLQQLDDSLALLKSILTEFRDDELEHLDTAVEHDAQQAPAHALLSAVVAYGCKGAIEIAKRV
ncbi:Putative ubiquinone biosynthesis monooxygenase [Malassezia yamatoensis]|uniref:Ubiquinone biosynthesis monooxygenase n=1 Tax=Malassezia yamatoensis TaxID=253288 RepID=A0AAJ5YSV0_9BASI|nr:Putative ubiquinone biosynthesis monooxygenase [Malassezia yamatoensis]